MSATVALAGFLTAVAVVLGFPSLAAACRLRASGFAGRVVMAGCVAAAVVLYAVWIRNASMPDAVMILIYAMGPLVFLIGAARAGGSPAATDWLVLAWIWIPVAAGGPFGGAEADSGAFLIRRLTGLALLLLAFVVFRPGGLAGYAWKLRLSDVATAAVALAAVLVVAVAAGLLAGDGWALTHRAAGGAGTLGIVAAAILARALPEEVVFRGLIFGFLQRTWMTRFGPWPALIGSALVFAIAEAATAAHGGVVLFTLAAWAGLWLGWSVLRTGSLLPAIAAHAALELIRGFS